MSTIVWTKILKKVKSIEEDEAKSCNGDDGPVDISLDWVKKSPPPLYTQQTQFYKLHILLKSEYVCFLGLFITFGKRVNSIFYD